MNEILLRINNLSISSVAEHKKLVGNVSFSIRRGEAFTLIGETGCGKTLVAQSMEYSGQYSGTDHNKILDLQGMEQSDFVASLRNLANLPYLLRLVNYRYFYKLKFCVCFRNRQFNDCEVPKQSLWMCLP